MSHLSVSDDDSSFEFIESSASSSPLSSSMESLDSANPDSVSKEAPTRNPALEPILPETETNQDWHLEITKDSRSAYIEKMIETLLRGISEVQEASPTVIQAARRTEKEIFDLSNSVEEYRARVEVELCEIQKANQKKKWRLEVSKDLREQLVGEIVKSTGGNLEEAKTLEEQCFWRAINFEEYLHLISKILQVEEVKVEVPSAEPVSYRKYFPEPREKFGVTRTFRDDHVEKIVNAIKYGDRCVQKARELEETLFNKAKSVEEYRKKVGKMVRLIGSGVSLQALQKKHPKLPEPLPILQELNGTWRQVTDGDGYAKQTLGECIKITTSPGNIEVCNYKANGEFYLFDSYPLHTEESPVQTKDRLDYIDGNEWKTFVNDVTIYHLVRWIDDGKLKVDYFGWEDGRSYEVVYERVEKESVSEDQIPKHVISELREHHVGNILAPYPSQSNFCSEEEARELEQALFRKAKSAVEYHEEVVKVLQRIQNGTTHQELQKEILKLEESLPILQELNGTWRRVTDGECIKITTTPQSIEVCYYKSDGDVHFQNTYPLYTKESPVYTKGRRDYIDGNEWKSMVHDGDVIVRSIVDGKLQVKCEFLWSGIFTMIYERCEEIPVVEQDLEEPEDQDFQENVEDEKTDRDHHPILQEISGTWKQVSTIKNSVLSQTLGIQRLMKIKATPSTIYFSQYLGPLQLSSRTALLNTSPCYDEGHLIKDSITSNKWICHWEKYKGYTSEKSIENGKLVVKVRSDEGGYTCVYERTHHFTDAAEIQNGRSTLALLFFGIGVLVTLLIVFIISF